jgi:hypothetical protein
MWYQLIVASISTKVGYSVISWKLNFMFENDDRDDDDDECDECDKMQ